MKKIETSDFICEYDDSDSIKNAVFERVMEFFKDHVSFNGECIIQNDISLIDAPNVLADIADDIIKFSVEWKWDD